MATLTQKTTTTTLKPAPVTLGISQIIDQNHEKKQQHDEEEEKEQVVSNKTLLAKIKQQTHDNNDDIKLFETEEEDKRRFNKRILKNQFNFNNYNGKKLKQEIEPQDEQQQQKRHEGDDSKSQNEHQQQQAQRTKTSKHDLIKEQRNQGELKEPLFADQISTNETTTTQAKQVADDELSKITPAMTFKTNSNYNNNNNNNNNKNISKYQNEIIKGNNNANANYISDHYHHQTNQANAFNNFNNNDAFHNDQVNNHDAHNEKESYNYDQYLTSPTTTRKTPEAFEIFNRNEVSKNQEIPQFSLRSYSPNNQGDIYTCLNTNTNNNNNNNINKKVVVLPTSAITFITNTETIKIIPTDTITKTQAEATTPTLKANIINNLIEYGENGHKQQQQQQQLSPKHQRECDSMKIPTSGQEIAKPTTTTAALATNRRTTNILPLAAFQAFNKPKKLVKDYLFKENKQKQQQQQQQEANVAELAEETVDVEFRVENGKEEEEAMEEEENGEEKWSDLVVSNEAGKIETFSLTTNVNRTSAEVFNFTKLLINNNSSDSIHNKNNYNNINVNENTKHIVKIKIDSSETTTKQVKNSEEIKPSFNKQITIIKLNDSPTSVQTPTPTPTPSSISTTTLRNKENLENLENFENSLLKENPSTTSSELNQFYIPANMVQKPSMISTASKTASNINNTINSSNNNINDNTNNGISCGNSITDLNVDNSPYHLYYMMSNSGQFSPCETLDSGTGSDLESNSHSPPINHNIANLNIVNAPKLEMNLKTTKIRVNSTSSNNSSISTSSSTASIPSKLSKSSSKILKDSASHSNNKLKADYIEHMRACSLTDSSEESESSSSLSCDSLHSNEFARQSSLSPCNDETPRSNLTKIITNKTIGALLPDSLLRDIRDRKFTSQDFEARSYRNKNLSLESVNENEFNHNDPEEDDDLDMDNKQKLNHHVTNDIDDDLQVDKNNQKNILQKLINKTNDNDNENSQQQHQHQQQQQQYRIDKRSSLPNKTFILDKQSGAFIDTKLNSMPRKYEADQYYNFHVNEHANFRSFGNNPTANNSLNDVEKSRSDSPNSSLNPQNGLTLESINENLSSFREDDFAGYKDIRCSSTTSTIRSSKGTVRGVKNRVRNGIATFLQMQQPNIKNYKEKDNGKVVLYTTSMGIIRDTHAKCSNVKQILRTLLVKFEERDVFMSIEYQQEIKERMNSHTIRVPQLFVEGQYIGDADMVERLNESGELRQLLKPYKSIATAYTCQTCGGYRLLPCPSCNGSKKSVHRNHFTAEFVALKCMNCDEVGLVKCHKC